LDILVGELGTLLPRSLDAILLLVCHGPTILASSFPVLLRSWTSFGTSVVPIVKFVR